MRSRAHDSRCYFHLLVTGPALIAALAAALVVAVPGRAAEPPPTTQPLPPVPRPADGGTLSTLPSVHVTAFRFTGNTVFASRDLAALPDVRKYVGRDDTLEDLEDARRAITQHYVDAGYINSGAVLPDQTVGADGVVRFEVIEGRLAEIRLTPATPRRLRLTKDYITGRVELGAGPPLNINVLKDRLETFRQNPNVQRVNAELKPGLRPGEGILDVAVEETNPYQLALEFNNKRSPSVGAERFYALASDLNVSGHGDAVNVRYGITKGGLDHMRLGGFDDFAFDYTLPINRYDTTLALSYVRSDDLVIETPFSSANITSRSDSGALTLRHPFYRSPNTEFAMSASLSRRTNRTAGGANDSRFLAWLGQAQYVRRIARDSELIIRFDTQLADNPLPAIEQISIGGFDTVRGYRENRLVRDQAAVASAELRVPVLRKAERPILDAAVFVDGGYGWNFHNESNNPPQLLSSAGVGLLYNPNRHVALQVYYGVPFKHFKNSNDIQDKGVHFDLVLSAFE